ncbi:MAG TPA: ATP synthase F0 subunit B [Verrucomicrobiales bacterium]|jgi:F-type H+-transporting ATPase subunit b|nr:ATP synthase F0 subunit B [Verrucomicrobiales bacterium]
MEILHQLGIDTPKLFAQIIIFGIVYFVLKKYAFGPVTDMLETRQRRIAEGEENLKKIKENLASSEAQAAAALSKANADADRMVKEAKDAAAAVGAAEQQKAVAEAAAIISKAREASELERARIMGELKRDFGRLVVDATSRVSGKALNEEDHARLNSEALAQVSNN